MSESGESFGADETGIAMFIDGSQPHCSTPFKGRRISVVAFLHKATRELPTTQKEYLRSLGFRLPVEGEGDVQANGCS